MSKMIHALNRNDRAISPVIGTILMVAATVIIAGAVYAAVNAYSGKSAKTPTEASWKAQTIDSNGDGLDDTIKVTYLAGPDGASNIGFSLKQSNGTALPAGGLHSGTWSPGDYETYKLQYGAPSGAVAVYITISQAGNTVLDQTLTLRQ